MSRFLTTLALAGHHYRRERLLSLCAILTLAAALVPLLSLMGLKDGIIGALTDRLLENPVNLQLSPVGAGQFDQAFFNDLIRQPETAFLIPETRNIAAVIQLNAPTGATLRVNLLPTAEGDPLLAGLDYKPGPPTEIFISASVGEKLGLKPGQTVRGSVSRRRDGITEFATVDLKIIGESPRYLLPKDTVMAPLPFLEMIEDYRDGLSVPALGWPGSAKPEAPPRYASFRLYARSLAGVEDLRRYLTAQGLEIYTKAEEIALVNSLERSFKMVFTVLALVVGAGAFAAAAGNALSQAAKMSRPLALLRLLGLTSRHLLLFTLLQAALTGLLAALLAEGLFLGVSVVLNHSFGASLGFGEQVCRLSREKLLAALGLSTIFMILASATAGFRLLGIEPSEGMRDV